MIFITKKATKSDSIKETVDTKNTIMSNPPSPYPISGLAGMYGASLDASEPYPNAMQAAVSLNLYGTMQAAPAHPFLQSNIVPLTNKDGNFMEAGLVATSYDTPKSREEILMDNIFEMISKLIAKGVEANKAADITCDLLLNRYKKGK